MEQDCFGGGLQIVLSNKAVGETKTTNLGNYRAGAGKLLRHFAADVMADFH